MDTNSTAEQFRHHVAEDCALEQIAIGAAAHVTAAMQVAAALDQIQPGDPLAPLEDLSKQFFSIAHACLVLGIVPATLRAGMLAARVRYAEVRNDVGYLDGHGLLKLLRYFKDAN